jgi:hypothetical protein
MIPAEIKMHMAQEIGVRLDDMLEGARKEVATFDGGKHALTLAHGKVTEHLKFIDKDMEDGKLDMEQSVLVKKYVLQILGILQNLCTGADVQKFQAQGKIAAFEASVKTTKSAFDIEKARVDLSKQAAVAPEAASQLSLERERPSGMHPGDPLAARRNEEVVAPPEPVPASAKSVVKRGPGRPRKNTRR